MPVELNMKLCKIPSSCQTMSLNLHAIHFTSLTPSKNRPPHNAFQKCLWNSFLEVKQRSPSENFKHLIKSRFLPWMKCWVSVCEIFYLPSNYFNFAFTIKWTPEKKNNFRVFTSNDNEIWLVLPLKFASSCQPQIFSSQIKQTKTAINTWSHQHSQEMTKSQTKFVNLCVKVSNCSV